MADKAPTSSMPVKPSTARPIPSLPLEEIREAVEKVRHGTVHLIIQDGRIVQIDTLEKKRLV